MRPIKFWFGSLVINPSRRIERADCETGKTRTVQEYARYTIAIEGMRRYLGHEGAMKITRGVTLDADRCEIVVNVPRLSSDHDADCARVERFINAVFFGEPTEGLDAAPSINAPVTP